MFSIKCCASCTHLKESLDLYCCLMQSECVNDAYLSSSHKEMKTKVKAELFFIFFDWKSLGEIFRLTDSDDVQQLHIKRQCHNVTVSTSLLSVK